MEIARKLRIQFVKHLRKRYLKNATLDPRVPSELLEHLEPAECVIVEVISRKDGRYFFTDRRIFLLRQSTTPQFCRYDKILHTHWMSKSGLRGMTINAEESPGANFKTENYDRLVLETSSGDFVLDGLEQSYLPIFNFFRWINR